MHPDYRKQLIKLLAETDQHIAEVTATLEAASMTLPDWFSCSEQLKGLEEVRGAIEGKLRAE